MNIQESKSLFHTRIFMLVKEIYPSSYISSFITTHLTCKKFCLIFLYFSKDPYKKFLLNILVVLKRFNTYAWKKNLRIQVQCARLNVIWYLLVFPVSSWMHIGICMATSISVLTAACFFRSSLQHNEPQSMSKSCDALNSKESAPCNPPRFRTGRKFTFQSTVRQIERRRIAEKLSKEAEQKGKWISFTWTFLWNFSG